MLGGSWASVQLEVAHLGLYLTKSIATSSISLVTKSHEPLSGVWSSGFGLREKG